MAKRPEKSRLNPTLFDKLVADTDISGMRGGEIEGLETSRESMRFYSVPQLERFNESALRATVRRDLAWLLNTTNLGAVVDLEPYPHVQTSVLNYGVADVAGKTLTWRFVQQRARQIRSAIRAFEPRIAEDTLFVEPASKAERRNSVTFTIQGDVTSAVKAVPIKFRTDFEADSTAATVRE
jgi:type VI secretion system protein ImpF